MLWWTTKYKPQQFAELKCHKEINNRLKRIIINNDMTHIILGGPEGSGKQTRMRALIHEAFGRKAMKTKERREKIIFENQLTYEGGANEKLEERIITLKYIESPYHYEISPADYGRNDRKIIHHIVKKRMMAEKVKISKEMEKKYQTATTRTAELLKSFMYFQSTNLSSSSSSSNRSSSTFTNTIQQSSQQSLQQSLPQPSQQSFKQPQQPYKEQQREKQGKWIIIKRAEGLSKEAQAALRRMMEETHNKFIFITTNYNAIIEPIRSRALYFRIPRPTQQDIIKVLKWIKENEYPNRTFDERIATQIIRLNENNLTKCILKYQLNQISKRTFTPQHLVEKCCQEIINILEKEQTIQQIERAREKSLILLGNHIAPEIVIKKMVQYFIATQTTLPLKTIHQVITCGAVVQQRLMSARANKLIHLEYFMTTLHQAIHTKTS